MKIRENVDLDAVSLSVFRDGPAGQELQRRLEKADCQLIFFEKGLIVYALDKERLYEGKKEIQAFAGRLATAHHCISS